MIKRKTNTAIAILGKAIKLGGTNNDNASCKDLYGNLSSFKSKFGFSQSYKK